MASLVDAASALRAQTAQAPQGELARSALLVCRVGGTLLAFEADKVQAILESRPAEPVPHTPPHVSGVITFGEGALAVVDLARFLNLAAGAPERSDLALERVVVLADGGLQAGLRCEKVAGILEHLGDLPAPRGVLQGERLTPYLVAELTDAQGVVGVLSAAALLEALKVKA